MWFRVRSWTFINNLTTYILAPSLTPSLSDSGVKRTRRDWVLPEEVGTWGLRPTHPLEPTFSVWGEVDPDPNEGLSRTRGEVRTDRERIPGETGKGEGELREWRDGPVEGPLVVGRSTVRSCSSTNTYPGKVLPPPSESKVGTGRVSDDDRLDLLSFTPDTQGLYRDRPRPGRVGERTEKFPVTGGIPS